MKISALLNLHALLTTDIINTLRSLLKLWVYIYVRVYMYTCIHTHTHKDPGGESMEDWGQGGLDKRCMDGFIVIVTEFEDLCTAYEHLSENIYPGRDTKQPSR